MGALRNFASRAAYLTMASLPGVSIIRTTIQLMSAVAGPIVRMTATGQCAFSASSVAVEPKIVRHSADPDGADANHLGVARCLHEHRPGRTTWDFGFDLDEFLWLASTANCASRSDFSACARSRRSRPGMNVSA